MKCIANVIVFFLIATNGWAQRADAIAYDALKKHLAKDYTHVEITPMHVVHPPLSGPYSVKVQKRVPLGKHVVVEVRDKKHVYSFWFHVKAYQEHLVAKHALTKGPLNTWDVEAKPIDIAGAPEGLKTLPAGAYLMRPIKKGQPIYSRDLRMNPLMKAGDRVIARTQSGQIELRFSANVQQTGRQEDVVLIRQMKTNKIFKARVINQHEVELL